MNMEADSMEDFLVPNLEDIAENPLIKDSFIGVTDPVLKWPLGVEFVEADESVSSSDVSYYSSLQLHPQQSHQLEQFNHQSPQARQRQESFNLGHLFASSPIDIPTQKQAFSFAGSHQTETVERSQINVSAFDSWLEDKTDLTQLGGWLTESTVVDDAFPEETQNATMEVVAKDQILQEIVRECEEIERRSSPDESSPSPIVCSPSVSSPSVSTSAPSPFVKSWTTQSLPQTKRQAVGMVSFERKGVKVRSKVVQKEKKKAQNREAATRYREKKRRERDGTRGDMLVLDERNRKLKTMVEDFEYEIQYLKNLMHEIGLEK